ncbi:hypothetical protein ACLKA6_017258 [Drosophila palustris]
MLGLCRAINKTPPTKKQNELSTLSRDSSSPVRLRPAVTNKDGERGLWDTARAASVFAGSTHDPPDDFLVRCLMSQRSTLLST